MNIWGKNRNRTSQKNDGVICKEHKGTNFSFTHFFFTSNVRSSTAFLDDDLVLLMPQYDALKAFCHCFY